MLGIRALSLKQVYFSQSAAIAFLSDWRAKWLFTMRFILLFAFLVSFFAVSYAAADIIKIFEYIINHTKEYYQYQSSLSAQLSPQSRTRDQRSC
ncbi:hypothetical protein AB6A40_010872 [Gnathostoma spinigerum]|uniref:Uncharacterized protein n=1 Tax=Gnathostoma spinigerum TaxID=75299 RepID=A0ABD6F2J9_9BILA